jgi:DNA-binding transcriptional ArsR family regulator
MSVGEVADYMRCPHNTASGHLSILARAQLVSSARFGRTVIYRADLNGMRRLIEYLLADCCNGDASMCAAAFASLRVATCVPRGKGCSTPTKRRVGQS